MSDTTTILCPACNTVNKVPSERLTDKPKCGRCHVVLFTGMPLTLDEKGFKRLIAVESVPLLVDFWAPWCGPCRQMASAFAEAAQALEPFMRIAKVDTDAVPSLSARFGIRSIPTLMVLRAGVEIARRPGAASTAGIVDWAQAELMKAS